MAQSTAVRLPTASEWREQIIEDIELQAIDAGVTVPPTAKGSDFDLKATALGNALAVLTANQVLTDADADPTRATGAALEEIRISGGLPEAPASAATGLVSVTVTSATPLTLSSGLGILAPGAMPASTVGAATGVVTGSRLPIVMLKAGSAGNLTAGTLVRFTAPPPGLDANATIVATMVDGADAENDTKKRRRILNRRQNPPACANPGMLRDVALGSTNAIDNAFVYPALGGPSSCKTVVTAPWFNSGSGQSRVASSAAVAIVGSAFTDAFNTDDALYHVESAANEYVDLHVRLRLLPGAANWTDADPWPAVAAQTSSVVSETSFHVTCASATVAPSPGKTIAVWSVADLAFRTATIVTSTTISATEYAVTTSGWAGGTITGFGDGTITSSVDGLPICPGAPNLKAWADKMLEIFGRLTPGEGCYTWQEPRSLRQPPESQDEPVAFGSRELSDFVADFDEIATASVSTINVATPTRTTPGVAPNVLTLRKLSFGRIV